MNTNDKATVAKVAKAAGVSVATVSRVINHRDLVKSETLNTVIEVMKSMGYELPALSDEGKRQNGLIIVNLPSLDNPFYSEIVKGAKVSAQQQGFHLLVNADHLNESTIENLIDIVKARKVSGVITANFAPPALLGKLNAVVPLVQCCEYSEDLQGIPYVAIDDYNATKTVMEHILSAGNRKIAFLSGPMRYKYARQRKKGYLHSLENANIEPNPDWIIHLPNINFDIALSAATQLLRSSSPPEAVFTVSDLCAAAVIKAARRLGINVPGKLVVTGFDNVDVSITTNPSITTVNLPRFQLGYIACDFLVERIKNPNGEPQQMLLDTELIIRESTSTSFQGE